MNWSNNLDGVHLDIAAATDNPNRVMAGPGTGKSYAMKRRLMRLLSEGAEPQRILAVTFTRTAAADMVKEIRSLGVDGCDKIAGGTLHSFCFGLLMKTGVLAWTRRVSRPLITFSDSGLLRFEIEPMFADLDRCGEFGDLWEKARRIRAFEAAWARQQADDPGQPQFPADREFLDAMLKWLRFHEAMLIGEVVPEALRFVRNNPAHPDRPEFEHVVVDEFQDLNKAEQVLLALLADGRAYAVFGDEDQSIYSFRYAHPEGIRTFNAEHPTTRDHSLQICQRCPKRVVAAANHFILQNHSGTVPRLVPKDTNRDGEFHIVQWRRAGDESHGIACYVKHLIEKKGYKPGDILILSPRRNFAYGMREALTKHGVPSHSFYHEEALEADEAREALAYLTLGTKSNDRVALRYLLGCASKSWEARGYEALRTHCESNNLAPWDALLSLEAGTLKLSYTKPLVKRFTEVRTKLEGLAPLDPAALVDALFPENIEWAEELRRAALFGALEGIEWMELLERLRTHVSQPEIPEDQEHVRIMSLHKSKGLTSKVVIVISCLEALISNRSAKPTAAETAEERRLFYVALTRCKEILVLSSFSLMPRKEAYQMGMQGALMAGTGEEGGVIASEFLSQLGTSAPKPTSGETFLRHE
jgi:DNA helicase II / ATP-dependent DNA helicase PcrA